MFVRYYVKKVWQQQHMHLLLREQVGDLTKVRHDYQVKPS